MRRGVLAWMQVFVAVPEMHAKNISEPTLVSPSLLPTPNEVVHVLASMVLSQPAEVGI